MIKFFRKIRYNLMEMGKTGKYLKYAIGEIFLVLIGILLALAISDWNDARVDKQSEIRTLIELKKGILIDLDTITVKQAEVNKSIADINYLQSLIKNKDYQYSKELDTLFGIVYGMRMLQPNSAFYEDLKSAGLKLVKNEAIRLQIVQLFENNYAKLNWINELEMSINDVNRPYYLNNFYDLTFSKYATPNNFKFVWTDSYYHNIIDYRLITFEKNHVIHYEQTIKAIKTLATAIDNYLDNKMI